MHRGILPGPGSTMHEYDDDDDVYLDDGPDHYPRSQSDTSSPPSPVTAMNTKKKHFCATCGRSFTTSGHLARHSRVHTGERNHKCPFPGCQTRCSRQDNLQQHYRIHLSPGSRRGSSASARAALKKMTETASSSEDRSRSRAMHRRVNPLPPLSAAPGSSTSAPPSTFGAEIFEGSRPPSVTPPPDTPPPLVPARPQPHVLTASYSSSSCSSASPSPHSDIVSQSVHPGIVDPAPVLMHSPQELSPHSYSHALSRSGAIPYEDQAKVATPAPVPPIPAYLDTTRQILSSAAPESHNQRFHQYTGSSGYLTASSPVSPAHQAESHHTGYNLQQQSHPQLSPVDPSPHVASYHPQPHPRSYEPNQNAQQAMRSGDHHHQHQSSGSDMYARYPNPPHSSTSRHSISHISSSHSHPHPSYSHSSSSASTSTTPQSVSPLTSERPTDHINAVTLSRQQPTLDAASFPGNERSFHAVYNAQGEVVEMPLSAGVDFTYAYRREADHSARHFTHPENPYQQTHPQSQPPTAPPSRYSSPHHALPLLQGRRELRVDVDARPNAYAGYQQHRAPQSQVAMAQPVTNYSQYVQQYDASGMMPYLHQPQPVVPVPQYKPAVPPGTGEDWRTTYDMRVRHVV